MSNPYHFSMNTNNHPGCLVKYLYEDILRKRTIKVTSRKPYIFQTLRFTFVQKIYEGLHFY